MNILQKVFCSAKYLFAIAFGYIFCWSTYEWSSVVARFNTYGFKASFNSNYAVHRKFLPFEVYYIPPVNDRKGTILRVFCKDKRSGDDIEVDFEIKKNTDLVFSDGNQDNGLYIYIDNKSLQRMVLYDCDFNGLIDGFYYTDLSNDTYFYTTSGVPNAVQYDGSTRIKMLK